MLDEPNGIAMRAAVGGQASVGSIRHGRGLFTSDLFRFLTDLRTHTDRGPF
jgi:hypothetical protein